jgi:Tol biopolymer transport system component
VDKRADIWAFGVVLWELLTGERLFKGEDVADTLAQVLTKEADVTRVPGGARKLLTECLQKDPKARLRDIGDAPRLVGQALPPESLDNDRPKGRSSLVAAAVFVITTAVALWAPWRSEPPVSEIRFQIPRPSAPSVPFLSPNGQRVAFISDARSISIRELNTLETRDLPSARPAAGSIIWSPDSRSIAYQSRDFKLTKLAFDGSPPVPLADLSAFSGGSWNEDGVILVGVRSGGLQRVPASGGALTPVTTLEKGQTEHRLPQFIGGGRFLYRAIGEAAASGLYAASLTDPNGKRVLPPMTDLSFFYVPPLAAGSDAYILYTSQSVLLAQAVDPSSLELNGPAVTIGQNAEAISASQNGTLLYGPSSTNQNALEWHWVDRTGKEIANLAGATGGADVTISPSGKRWARSMGGNIWLHDVAGGAPSRFTFEPTNDRFFAWSPDDQWIAYATGQGRAHDRILRKNTLTSAATETLVSGGSDFAVSSWSRDGKFLLFSDTGKSTGVDLWTLDLQAKGAKPVLYLQTPASERNGAFSPDGRWIAYRSDESGQYEVYVQSFPLGGGKFQVSTGGGDFPRWRADGRELYFVSGDKLVAAKIQTSPRFEAGAPQTLFGIPLNTTRNYDVMPDGNRFLVPRLAADEREVPPATVVINWQAGLKK